MLAIFVWIFVVVCGGSLMRSALRVLDSEHPLSNKKMLLVSFDLTVGGASFIIGIVNLTILWFF